MIITGVLFDITGIQRYIFGSNKLKENLGASFLVESIYKEFLRDIANSVFRGRERLDCWHHERERLYIKDSNVDMEIGYIGGGNALLFFRDQDKAVQFVKEWSKRLLVETSGLSTAVAMKDIDLDNPQQGVTDLFKELNKNKFTYHPQVTLPRHGITTECSHTGLSAECHWVEDKKEEYISSVAASKLKHEGPAHKMFSDLFKDILADYKFPKKLEELGQSKGESHIAIVHIDGNDMGKRFMECATIPALRDLSISLRQATEGAMKSLLKQIPIRPIILGGDDVTFVTDARLGVYFAEEFIKVFVQKKVSDNKPLSVCAGVAITKTKYPFYRGYELAEQLCSSAKKKAKDKEGESWLDFHIAYGGFSGELSDIRERHYTVKTGELCYRPYRICPETVDSYSFTEFKKGMKRLHQWPRNKQKELIEVLGLGEEATKQFITDMKHRVHILPDIQGIPELKDRGWCNQKTPYFDMLELMEFYPLDKIKEGD